MDEKVIPEGSSEDQVADIHKIRERALDYAFQAYPYRQRDQEGVDPDKVIESARKFELFLTENRVL